MRSCQTCAADITGTHHTRRYCNDKCRSMSNAPGYRERTKRWRQRNPEHAARLDLEKHLRRKYGITPDDYYRLVAEQENRCAICNRTPDEVGDKRRLAVDHCHISNSIRGLLCRPCNTSLGAFQESAEILERAVKYLKGQLI